MGSTTSSKEEQKEHNINFNQILNTRVQVSSTYPAPLSPRSEAKLISTAASAQATQARNSAKNKQKAWAVPTTLVRRGWDHENDHGGICNHSDHDVESDGDDEEEEKASSRPAKPTIQSAPKVLLKQEGDEDMNHHEIAAKNRPDRNHPDMGHCRRAWDHEHHDG